MSMMEMASPEKISFRYPQLIRLKGHDIIVKSEIGSGGFGSVFKIEQNGRELAMKLYRMWEVLPTERKDLLQRIFQEYKISDKIDSPYVIKIFDYHEFGANPMLIMEYCDGGSLREIIGRSLNNYDVLKISEDILKGLIAMHDKGIVHRDIKPENILLKPDNFALTDFGVSVSLNKRLTQTDIRGRVKQIFASAAYSPPEQVSGHLAFKNTGPTNDIYAFGVVLYELLTEGNLPFGTFEQYKSDPIQYEKRKKTEEWDYTRLIDMEVKAFWKNIIVKCLKPQPEDRFQTVDQIYELLKNSDFSTKNHSNLKSVNVNQTKQGCHLTITSRSQSEQRFNLSSLSKKKNTTRLTIGTVSSTDYNDINLEENYEVQVSRFHATLEKYMKEQGKEEWHIRDGQWYIKNGMLGWYLSHEGVYVNNQKVGMYGVSLQEGDVINIGRVQMIFHQP